MGQNWLKNVENGKYFAEEYVAHLDLPSSEDTLVVILTTKRILLVKVAKLKVGWDVPISDLSTISLEASGISASIAQLAEARRAMAARMEQEYQELDAGVPAPGEGEPSAAEGSGGRAEEGDEATPTQHRRRASVASSEGDDELVERLLRPQAAQAIPEEPSGGDAKASEEEEKGDAPPQDDRMCRICFSGDDEDEMGKLFSPCLCRGTSRHVHTKCLESWRKASANPRAFYQCDSDSPVRRACEEVGA
ncbi:Vacuolar protein sorting-associated protein 13 [Rhodotorula kratochvilovae]